MTHLPIARTWPRKHLLGWLLILLLGEITLAQEPRPANYDEAKIPPYTLPDPLVALDGRRISTGADWLARRRPELLKLFAEHVYGQTPLGGETCQARLLEEDTQALSGRAVKKVVEIAVADSPTAPRLTLHLYLPTRSASTPVPVFVGVNLFDRKDAIPQPAGRVVAEGRPIPEGLDPAMLPGPETIFRILERGYGIATFHPKDIAPDDTKTFAQGIIGWVNQQRSTREPSEWGALGAWAWGISRAVDYLRSDPQVDPQRIIAIGHSRNGKTALWAAAQDERIAAVISNQSGCGGAALSKRVFGETVALINKRFPFWFCEKFHTYDDREEDLPVDQHLLLASIAPRPVHVGSASGDGWADPRGEFLSVVQAEPAFALFGPTGLTTQEFPPINRVVGEQLSYHCRSGQHALADYDWMVYLDWCDQVLRKR
jgi:hypothetical protein